MKMTSSSNKWILWLAAALMAAAWFAGPRLSARAQDESATAVSAEAQPVADDQAEAKQASDTAEDTPADEVADGDVKEEEEAATDETANEKAKEEKAPKAAKADDGKTPAEKSSPESDQGESESAPLRDAAAEGESTDGQSDAGTDGKTDGESTKTPATPGVGAAAAGTPTTKSEGMSSLMKVAIVLAILIVPILIGGWLAKRLRMPELGWKINLILITIVAGSFIVGFGWRDITLGPDLRGGIKMIYEYTPKQAEDEDQQQSNANLAEQMIAAIRRRVDPGGIKEMSIREYGENQVEIIIPNVGDEERTLLKRKLSSSGALEFRITANKEDHADLIEAALKSNAPRVTVEGRTARWVKLGDDEKLKGNPEYVTRSDRTPNSGDEILIVLDRYNVTGEYLNRAQRGIDNVGRPAVLFGFNAAGASRFGQLTGSNLPNPATGRKRSLGIVLDDVLLSAPSINSVITTDGIIEGDFTREEVDFNVSILQAGSMPAQMAKDPLSEETMSAQLGEDMIKQGSRAVVLSVVLVLVFMLIYYHFAGLVACLALMVNLILILAVMISVRAAFTLPGLAGLVLTIGMAVDANVLIFERIREELNRGAALRMAIRNGFGRATTTIVDANLTTLITAIVLFWIGTAEIKGFAVILILGILMSMYTAIFCSRIVFDIAERRRWVSGLSMLKIVGSTHLNFLGWRNVAVGMSCIVILIGMVGVFGRGSNLLGIDFTGGASVTFEFRVGEGMEIAEVRRLVTEEAGFQDATVVAIDDEEVAGPPHRYVFNARTSGVRTARLHLKKSVSLSAEQVKNKAVEAGYPDAVVHPLKGVVGGFEVAVRSMDFAEVKDTLAEAFKGQLVDNSPDGEKGAITEYSELQQIQEALHQLFGDKLQTYSVNFGDLKQIASKPGGSAGRTSGGQTSDDESGKTSRTENSDVGKVTPVAYLQEDAKGKEEAKGSQPPESKESSPDKSRPSDDASDKTSDAAAASDLFAGGTETKLRFAKGIMQDTLRQRIQHNLDDAGYEDVVFSVTNPDLSPNSAQRFTDWDLKITLPPAEAEAVLTKLSQEMSSLPVFPSSSNIGGKVAGDTQTQAGLALFLSLLFIIGYIWVRFQRVMFGLAAVLALVHDVLVTLGVLALSYYLVSLAGPVADALLIDPFKISLPILAAFLTIIGYSLNDTIVVFDRIREVRGKSPTLTADMINTSINQTLSRTLLTSLTTLIVVVVLYIFGGEGIHGFAFALVVGVVAGTYSSIFIAAPVLFWMSQSGERAARRKAAATS